ncbi:MAG: 4-hydroxy-3-methylbut-2-enyl diphosphate reductase [Thermodesulfobacterium sp.]|nr:4-hydroxy-3-methylbut-2-enyl diphosphate reductase [Thermodesulfobacterium sp.]
MKVKIAKKAGFCMGVRRALNLVLKALNEKKHPIYTYGPLIHNPQTLELLNRLGVRIIKSLETGFPSGVCIIRAHGIPPQEKKILSKKHEILDGTCPRVLKVQALAKKAVSEGKNVVIIGDKNHAEIKGILGYCKDKGYVVNSFEDIEKLPELKDYVILSQTTQDKRLFKELSNAILLKFPNGEIVNTICNATEVRQNEVKELSKTCSSIIVIGGKFSANTNRLAEIAKKEGKKVYLIERAEEIPLEEIKKEKTIGITAGASTPNWLINEVVDFLKSHTSKFYKFLKSFSFLSFLQSFNFIFLLLGILNFINHPFNLRTLFLTLATFSFLMLKYNLENLQNIKELEFFYSIKGTFLKNHKRFVKFILILFAALSVVSGFLYHPRILALFVVILILNQVLLKTVFYFLIEPLLLTGISLFLYPFWNFSFTLIFLQAIFILLFLRLYFESVYFHTDGFLPPNFLCSYLGYKENRIYRLMVILIVLGLLFSLPLIYINKLYALFLILWILAYKLLLIIKKRPLGQIVYLETLSLILPLSFILLNLL